jgi:ubiquinone/menaquinone biosynthesis C-methylase UbiE
MKAPTRQTNRQELNRSRKAVPLFSRAEIRANHARRLARDALHRRFGYDSAASVGFVVKKALPLRGRVLDIGTGKGRFVIPLARHGVKVTTVDISAEEQVFARLEAMHAGVVDRIEFVRADARSLPWQVSSFDAVTCCNAFHHFTDPDRVFTEMLRVLRPGGKLVLADFSPSGFRIMDEIHASEGRSHPHPTKSFAHWRARLQRQGFRARRFMGQHQEVLVADLRSARAPPYSHRKQLLTKPAGNNNYEQRKPDPRIE